jgi:MFS family permease
MSRGTATPWVMLAVLALAELLGMTLWFSATAVAPALVAELRLSAGEAAWLTMAVQIGFVAGTLVSALLSLADVLNARWLFGLGCLAGAVVNGWLIRAGGAGQAIVIRFATGFALAWVYPPAMKIAAGWFGRRRGTALGLLIGALTVGSAFPHLLAWLASGIGWRALILGSSVLALAGGAIVVAFVRDGPYIAPTAPFDPRAIGRVFVDRRVRLATLGYLGHMWELYAMWTWIATFAAASLAAREVTALRAGSLMAFFAIASGAAGCAAAGLVGDRLGKARVAGWAMMVSGGCCAVAGFAYGADPRLLAVFLMVWGFAVVADSALFSALVSEYSSREYVGTALTVQVCAGFLLTMVTIRLLPLLASTGGWRWVFIALAPGPALGVLAMRTLERISVQKEGVVN